MTFLFDLDGTICTETNGDYPVARPIRLRIRRINALRRAGNKIILWTARGTITGVNWRQLTERQLREWGVKYDELLFGKPPADIYVCDKALNVVAWDAEYPAANGRVRSASIQAWSKPELLKLRLLYPHAFNEELPLLFSKRSATALKAKALIIGIRKTWRTVIFKRHFESEQLGGYVSGLVDGEGWFAVSINAGCGAVHCSPKFGVSLRKDDIGVLEFLRGYFGCGRINFSPRPNPNHAPVAVFCISGLYNILWSVIPHFTRYPLRAKKSKDFTTWCAIANLAAQHYGKSRWPEEARAEMFRLRAKLIADKQYKEPA